MKKLLVTLLAAMLLTGCSFPETIRDTLVEQGVLVPNTAPSETVPVTEPAVEIPTETEPPTGTQPTETTPAPEPTQPPAQPEPADGDFVKVTAYIPDIVVDLRYATENNFTQQVIYDFDEVWLRYGTVKKLMALQAELKENGLGLKIWDGFRPPAAQFRLWEICPDPTYVSDPNKGFSSHSRGNTVDLTLVRSDGTELTMPTGFDDFSKLADRDYSDCTEEAANNALYLENLMTGHGFKPYSGEWWHFTDTQSYDVEESFQPVAAGTYYANCNEFISLRTGPSTAASVITRIPAGDEFDVVARQGDFALVEYRGLSGFVLSGYIKPLA